jgi:hypothetical protein
LPPPSSSGGIRSTAPTNQQKKANLFGDNEEEEEEDFKPVAAKALPVIGAKPQAPVPDRKTAATPADSKSKFNNLFMDDEDEDY